MSNILDVFKFVLAVVVFIRVWVGKILAFIVLIVVSYFVFGFIYFSVFMKPFAGV